MDIRKSEITLDPTEIPHDITFVIQECGSKVKAHKLIMAMSSPMCMQQFYGELKELNDEIVIKDASKDAFCTMIDYFYGKEVDWKKKTVEELFGIGNMAEKYQVSSLKEKIPGAVEFLEVNEENVVIIAAKAEEYSHFEYVANSILLKCREFLSSVLRVRGNYCKFAKKYAGSELADVALKLIAGMENVNPTSKGCCKLNLCRRGKPMLETSDFVVGEKVQFNPEAKEKDVTDAQRRNRVVGTVRKIESSIKAFSPNRSVILLDGDDWHPCGYWMRYQNVATFLFNKC